MVSRSVCEACTATAVMQAAAALATQRGGRASDRRPLLLACIDYAAAVVLSLADLSRPPAVRSSSVPTSLRPDPDAAPHLGASTTTVWCHAGFLSHLLTLPLLSVVLAGCSPAAASTRYVLVFCGTWTVGSRRLHYITYEIYKAPLYTESDRSASKMLTVSCETLV